MLALNDNQIIKNILMPDVICLGTATGPYEGFVCETEWLSLVRRGSRLVLKNSLLHGTERKWID